MEQPKGVIPLVTTCLFACGLLIGVPLAYPALADVGPVWTAQGADIEPGEEPTQVQMVSETVLVAVEALEPPSDETLIWMHQRVMTHVEATVLMRNHGTRPRRWRSGSP